MNSMVKMAAALVLGFVVTGAMTSCGPPSRASAEAQLDREAARDPVISAIREADPALYARIRESAATQLSDGGSLDDVRTAVTGAARAYIGQQMGAIATAPSEAQLAAFTAERDLLVLLRGVDIETCANAAMGVPGERDPAGMDDRIGQAFGHAIAARLEAAAAGRAQPTEHAAVEPTDAQAVRDGMLAEGLDPRVVDGLLMGAINALSAQEKCDGTIGFSNAILAQPAASRERLVAMVFTTLAQVTPPTP